VQRVFGADGARESQAARSGDSYGLRRTATVH